MSHGPLTVHVLHKILRQSEKLLTKYDLERTVKEEDPLDNFYLHLQMLEVRYDDVEFRILPSNLDGREVVWYHIIPPKSIQSWNGFKNLFLEKLVDDKTPTMLLKELENMQMEHKEKVKYFNQRFNHILNEFLVNTKPHDSICNIPKLACS